MHIYIERERDGAAILPDPGDGARRTPRFGASLHSENTCWIPGTWTSKIAKIMDPILPSMLSILEYWAMILGFFEGPGTDLGLKPTHAKKKKRGQTVRRKASTRVRWAPGRVPIPMLIRVCVDLCAPSQADAVGTVRLKKRLPMTMPTARFWLQDC